MRVYNAIMMVYLYLAAMILSITLLELHELFMKL